MVITNITKTGQTIDSHHGEAEEDLEAKQREITDARAKLPQHRKDALKHYLKVFSTSKEHKLQNQLAEYKEIKQTIRERCQHYAHAFQIDSFFEKVKAEELQNVVNETLKRRFDLQLRLVRHQNTLDAAQNGVVDGTKAPLPGSDLEDNSESVSAMDSDEFNQFSLNRSLKLD